MTTGKLRTEAYEHNMVRDFTCQLCGRSHEQYNASVRMMKGDCRVLAGICMTCIDVGANGAAQRMRNWASDLEGHAHDLRALADDVEGIKHWAGLDALARMELFTDENRIGPSNYIMAQVPGRVEELRRRAKREARSFVSRCRLES